MQYLLLKALFWVCLTEMSHCVVPGIAKRPVQTQAFQSMVKRAAMQRSMERHAGALMSAISAELAAAKHCFEAVRQEPVQVQGGRSALPRLAGGALAASHLTRRITATWTSLQVPLT